MKTVRDFKRMVEAEWPSKEWEESQLAFFRKLDRLGARNMEKFPPEEVPDIDATVELSVNEWKALEQEFNDIKTSLGRVPAILGFRKQ